ncbi:MAG: exosortase/archaeosortase family protein [Armatimonadetes bacterium]|nr:exosortase/archaeosortase family protein [Armatimonadota bacterium]
MTNVAPDTTPAPDVAPPSPSPLARFRDAAVAEAGAIGALVRRSPEWAVILFAWLAAGFIPAFWYMGEDHWWIETDSPLFFQPFVPLLCAVIFWQDREKLREAWAQTSRSKRHGSPWLLYIGCVIILVSHLIHVLTVATVGLLVVAAGVIYLAYGWNVLKASRRALLFGLLMIPPPATMVSAAARIIGSQIWKIITIGLQAAGKICSMTPGVGTVNFQISGQVYEIGYSQTAVIVFTGVALLFVAILRRERFGKALILMASGALLATLLSIIVPFLTLLLPVSPLTDSLLKLHPAYLAVVSTLIPVLVIRRLRAWSSTLSQGSRVLNKMGQAAQKATDKALSGGASRMDGSVGRAGRGVNRGFESVMDRIGAAIAKPFKRKNRNRW